MERVILQAEPRSIIGRQVKSLRRRGFVPAVVYGHGFKPLSIQVPVNEFERVYTEAGESTVIYLNVDGQDHPTIIHDVVRDPLNDIFLHADFYKVRLDEKIHAKIQLNFIGESPAVKGLGGILVKNLSEIEVEGFPQDLPHQIDVDISVLAEFKSQILVKDLSISKKLEVKVEPEVIVALVQEPISEEELKAQLETPVTTAPEEVEVIKKEKPEEEVAEEAPVSSEKKE
ncbi:MAG: 50S ribosomal protein L25 [Candidatus Yanofskybacteria bacterium]|nr:50S ribosomal protein L25 [Candidatus Yanofskybacteria bacterium]